MRRLFRMVLKLAAGLVLVCLLPAVARAVEPQLHMEILPEEIVGVALFPDGETPVMDLPVRVWNIDRQKMIYRTQTDENGVFEIPLINPSRCFVFVGRVKVNLRILAPEQGAVLQHHDLVVVIPRGMLLVSGPNLMDIIIAPLVMKPPEEPKEVSP